MKEVPTLGRSSRTNIGDPSPQIAGRTGCAASKRVSVVRLHRQAATLVPCGRGFRVLLSLLRMVFIQYQKNLLEARYACSQDSSRFSPQPLPSLLCKTSELIISLELQGLSESGCFLYGQLQPSLAYGSYSGPCTCLAVYTLALPGPGRCYTVFLGNLSKAPSLSGTETALNQFTPAAVPHILALLWD